MRLSIDRNSLFFSPAARRAQVIFNGRKLARCVEADEEGGHATIIHCNAKGRPVIDSMRGRIVTVVLHVNVRIDLMPVPETA